MIAASCAHGIRYNPNKLNVNTARFATESVRIRSSLLSYSLRKSRLRHRCVARSSITDMETPAINDSNMLIATKQLQTADASCVRRLRAALQVWGWREPGQEPGQELGREPGWCCARAEQRPAGK